MRHLYFPDLIIYKLETKVLKVTLTVIGYYEGCHRKYHDFTPDVNLDLARYRKYLDRIKCLEVVGLQHKICCLDHPEHIIEEAVKRHLDTVLCLCSGCYLRANLLSKNRIHMKYFPEIVLRVLAQ
jgi:hypothetical protein